MRGALKYILAVLILVTGAVSCGEKDVLRDSYRDSYDKVFVYCALGFNNLAPDLRKNLESIAESPLPRKGSDRVVLAYCHFCTPTENWSITGRSRPHTPTPSHLVRLYSDEYGNTVRDTLVTTPVSSKMTDPDEMSAMLEYIHENFPAKEYGLMFSSHGTGWLPEGYYASPQDDDDGSGFLWLSARKARRRLPIELPDPRVKGFGAEFEKVSGELYQYEMDIPELASAIPMKVDYIIFDACLMGCVEVAYELADVTDKVCFSPAEVLVAGFDYSPLTGDLLKGKEIRLEQFAQSYYEKYAAKKGWECTATITVVDCTKLAPLSSVCRELSGKYREGISSLKKNDVQGFWRSDRHYFYDLKDIFEKGGASEEDLAALQDALDGCITYKAATPTILGEVEINTYCGLSMYLPSVGSSYLDSFYKTLKWNESTGLVQ